VIEPVPEQGAPSSGSIRSPNRTEPEQSPGLRKAQVFVAVLGASNYTYAEASWTQSLPDWL
jgi:transposase